MNEFWTFIDVQRELIPIPVDSYEDRLNLAVKALGSAELKVCRTEYATALDRLNKIEIWEACSLLSGVPCGDSSFLYFRNWIVWQGRSFVESIASNADDLLPLAEQRGIGLSEPFIESLDLLSKAGNGFFEIPSASDFQERWNWQDSSAGKIAVDLPKLWAVYGQSFQWELPAPPSSQEEEIPGLGLLRVGDVVRHLFGYGVGTIVSFPIAGSSIAAIDFANEQKTMHIASQYFERPKATDASA